MSFVLIFICIELVTSLVAQIVQRLPTMWETRVQFLGWEDSLEKEMATHSSTLDWKIPWTEEPGGLPSWSNKESDTIERLHFPSVGCTRSQLQLMGSLIFSCGIPDPVP